jgi:hypothetical protein
VRMAIEARWGAVSGPSCVCNTSVRIKDLSQVGLLILDQLLQLGNFADLLEGKDLVLLVTIYSQTSRVIATVFEPGEAIDEGVEDEFPVLLDEVVDVAKNTTAKIWSARLTREAFLESRWVMGTDRSRQTCIRTTWLVFV